MIKLDHFYVKVTNLQEAIDFYEDILKASISNREGDRWADFEKESGVYLGILNTKIDGESIDSGNNITLALKTNEIEVEHKRISKMNSIEVTEIYTITQPALYKYFEFKDPWGNIWEIAQYDY